MGNLRLLLAEHQTIVRQMLGIVTRAQLAADVVAECGSITEGVGLCLAHKPDLVLVSWMLADGRGFELVRRTAPKLPRTRWVFLSANEQLNVVQEAAELGVHGFVHQRSGLASLLSAISAVTEGRSYYCAASSRLLVEGLRSRGRVATLSLTSREREVLHGIASGDSVKDIATRLGLETKTVNNHLTSLKDKLGIHEAAGLVRYAMKYGYTETP